MLFLTKNREYNLDKLNINYQKKILTKKLNIEYINVNIGGKMKVYKIKKI